MSWCLSTWLGGDAKDTSLYLRPFMIAIDLTLGASEPLRTHLFAAIPSPPGPYSAPDQHPIPVWQSDQFLRAAARLVTPPVIDMVLSSVTR